MTAGEHSVLYAKVCLRLSLQRERSALERLGLTGIQSRDRISGAATSSRSYFGRFDSPGFPVLYAAEDVKTCEAEVSHHLTTHYLRHAKGSRAQTFTYRVLEVPISGRFDDLRTPSRAGLRAPTRLSYPFCRQYALAAFQAGMDGLLFPSARNRGGTCLARFLPNGLRLPVQDMGFRVFSWTGRKLVLQP